MEYIEPDATDPFGDFVLPGWDLTGETIAFDPTVLDPEPAPCCDPVWLDGYGQPMLEADAYAAPYDAIELWSAAPEEPIVEDPPDATWPAGESDLWN